MARDGSGDQVSTSVPRGRTGPSTEGLRSRTAASKASAPKTSAKSVAKAPASNGGFSLRFYDDDAPGLKVGPTAVLVTSLVYIACVILLHLWGKFRAPAE
mmetsp:Transcript_2728/g.8276  ORF Transcript_2728/g.8276 Transcript_2728/m.8276 type:complete len:100 (-) Transcript_2728:2031-2330(-)